MGHDIRAFSDPKLQTEIATMRLFPSQGRHEGNIYDVLGCQKFRRSCSGSGEIAEFDWGAENYSVEPNRDSQKFLDDISAAGHDGRVWIIFH